MQGAWVWSLIEKLRFPHARECYQKSKKITLLYVKDVFSKTRSGLRKQLIWLANYCQKEQLHKYHTKTKIVFVRSLPLFRWTVLNNIHAVARSWTWLSDFIFTFHFHALEKEMATHCSVLAWRIPGTGEPGGLPSMGSHRVGHNWSDLAAAAAYKNFFLCLLLFLKEWLTAISSLH